jgi:hypothetical protein
MFPTIMAGDKRGLLCHCEEFRLPWAAETTKQSPTLESLREGDCFVPVPLRGTEGLAMTD